MDIQPQNPIQTPPQQPISLEPSLAKRTFTPKFIAVLIGLLVVGLIAYGYVAYLGLQSYNKIVDEAQKAQNSVPVRTPDPFAGWQTYRNEEYGFELRYPFSWDTYRTKIESSIVFSEQVDYGFTIHLLPLGINTESKTEEEILNSFFGFLVKDGQYFAYDGLTEGTLARDEIVNGIKKVTADIPIRTYDERGNYMGIGEGIRVLFSNGKNYALFEARPLDKYVFDQILSTFKFIDN